MTDPVDITSDVIELNFSGGDGGGERRESDVNREARKLLLTNPNVYQRGGVLVQICDGAISQMSHAVVQHELSDVADFRRWETDEDENGKKRQYLKTVHPPSHCVSYLTQAKYSASEGRPLNAVLRAPTITITGDIVSKRGYDPSTGFFLPEDQLLLEGVTIDQAVACLSQPGWTDWLTDSPYTDPQLHIGVMVAMWMTVLARPLLWLEGAEVPGLILDAGDGGAGKTLLSGVIATVAGQADAAALTWADDPAELQKRADAALFLGEPILSFDNVRTGAIVDAPTLTSWMTATKTVGARPLGLSELRRVPWMSTVILNGCNIGLKDELSRRFLRIRLSADPSKKYLRSPTEYRRLITSDLALIRTCCLLLLQEHLRGGHHHARAERELLSFGLWQQIVGECVRRHFGVNVADALAKDLNGEADELGEFFESLAPHMQQPTSTGELVDPGSSGAFTIISEWLQARKGKHATVSKVSVGKEFSRICDRKPQGGYVLRKVRDTEVKCWKWVLEKTG